MSQFIRPFPPQQNQDSYATQVGAMINGGRLEAGKGIRLIRHGNNTTVESTNTRVQDSMNYRGAYDFNAQYFPNDVVYVDPNATYVDQNGIPIPVGTSSSGSYKISPGTYICINYVGASWQDDTLLTTQIGPAFTSAGGFVTDDMSDHYRHYDCNVYFPTSPQVTGLTRKAESYWTTVVSQSYWAPLGGTGGGGMNWQGNYNESASYARYDVIWVDPNTSYSVPFTSTSGSTPPLVPGTFICVNAIPSTASGSRPTGNYYYPIYPLWSTSSIVTVSGSIYNQQFWAPITPMIQMSVCTEGVTNQFWVAGVISGSTYRYSLPYP